MTSIHAVLRATARAAGVTVDVLTGPTRKQVIARPRLAGMALAHRLTGKSYGQVARAFGRTNHTTVIHAIHCTASPDVADWVDRIRGEM
jgi:chromosomal replication initiator protein